ncbi:MAG: DUF4058 family protein [Planctomycetaceae bacterium]
MPSPFPGMDPFLESQEWEDFHSRFNTALSDALSSSLRPNYFVRVERRLYVEEPDLGKWSIRRADVAVVADDAGPASGRQTETTASGATICTLPMPVERRETYLVIRERASSEVVTVIELLSPSNKRKGGRGHQEYLQKRMDIVSSMTHLVEIDLLRGGERLPIREPLPPGDYYCVVSRGDTRPRAELYSWALADPIPSIPIPLKRGDADVVVSMQEILDLVYDRAGYDLSLDYNADLDPKPEPEVQDWIRKCVAEASESD